MSRRPPDRGDMRLVAICLVLCVAALSAAADGAGGRGLLHTKARLVGKLGRHHKRGVYGSVPTFKLGHDIPHVTHSVVKPVVVTYPPAATVTTVKVPLSHRLIPRYPHGHHAAAAPRPHFSKFPHPNTVVLPRPDQHFHHHHHHVAPRPAVPVLPASPHTPAIVPVAQPTVPIPQPLPPPPLVVQPTPLFPAPPPHLHPQQVPVIHRPHVSPLLPAATVPLHPAPVFPAPAVQFAPQLQYVLRPGNAIQTSIFATYPRYPFGNYRPLYPLTAPPAVGPAPVVPAPPPAWLEHFQTPNFHVSPSPVIPQALPVAPTPTIVHEGPAAPPAVHLHPTQQVTVEHDGWAPLQPNAHNVALQGDFVQGTHYQFNQEAHHQFNQEAHHQLNQEPHHQFAHDVQQQQAHDANHQAFSPEAHPQFTQEQGTQVYEHHTEEEQQYYELQHHVQQQLEQAQFEKHLNNQHQLSQDYGALQQNQGFGQSNGQYSQQDASHGQDFTQHQGFNYNQQPGAEYGAPGVEGRSGEGEVEGEELRYHNHIPLGLQPPLDRPLEHFR